MNMTETNCPRKSLLQKFESLLAIIEDEKLEHFEAALEQVANCYTASNVNAVLLVQNTSEESQSAFSINADQQQAAKMISFMAEAMKHIDDSNSRGQLN
jgi:hypothetical protein